MLESFFYSKLKHTIARYNSFHCLCAVKKYSYPILFNRTPLQKALFSNHYLVRESLLANCSVFQGFYSNCVLKVQCVSKLAHIPKAFKIKQPCRMSSRGTIGLSDVHAMIYENSCTKNLELGRGEFSSHCSSWCLIRPGHSLSLPLTLSHYTLHLSSAASSLHAT